MLEQEGWDAFQVVLGSDADCAKGAPTTTASPPPPPTTPGPSRPSPSATARRDMRLGAEHGVPVRIGIDRDGDPQSLLAAGATHIVRALADILPIVAAA